jgi:hypothetical protein
MLYALCLFASSSLCPSPPLAPLLLWWLLFFSPAVCHCFVCFHCLARVFVFVFVCGWCHATDSSTTTNHYNCCFYWSVVVQYSYYSSNSLSDYRMHNFICDISNVLSLDDSARAYRVWVAIRPCGCTTPTSLSLSLSLRSSSLLVS